MDQNKIKNCFNSVNVSNLPTAFDLLQKVEEQKKDRKINTKLFTIGTLCLSVLSIFIVLVIINLTKPTPPNPTIYNTIEVTPNSFNLLYDLSLEETSDNKLNINFKKKLSNAVYNDVEVTIKYILNEEEQMNEYTQTIKLNNINNIILSDSEETQIEKVNIIDTKGNVLVNNNDYQEILSQQEMINLFYNKLYSYNTNSYIYDFNTHLDYYLVDYDDNIDKIESVLRDINDYTNYLGYQKESYYRLESKSKLNNNNERIIDNIIMEYMNTPTYITNIYEPTPNGKYGIKLDAFDSFDNAVNSLYKKYPYFNVETLINLLSKDNLNLSGITIKNIISNEDKDNLIHKYELTGLFNNFYLLDEKIFNSNYISSSTYKKFYDDEVTLTIIMDNNSISLELNFENNDDIYGYRSDHPLTPGELKDPDKLEIIRKFEYSIELFEKFTFTTFNESSLNNYVDNEENYTYLPAENIEDVYKEIKNNEDIHSESFNQLKTSYYKIFLTKGQYYLHDITENFSHNRKVYLYNENKELIDLGIHNNDIYFHNLSSTFVVEHDGYYYIGIEGGQEVIDFRIDKINNETYYDINNPILINSELINVHFDNSYDLFYYNYYSERDGVIKFEVLNAEVYLYYYNSNSSNGYVGYNKNHGLSKDTTIEVKKGNNIIIVCLNPGLIPESTNLDCEIKFNFLSEDKGYSSEIEYMPIITTNYFENPFNPIYNHPIYLKLETYQYGQYIFNIEDIKDQTEYELLDENHNKISNIYNDSKLILEEGVYIIKAVSYYFEGSLFNIKYEYSEIIEEDANYKEFEYTGGNKSFEFEFSPELPSLIFEYHITFSDDYIVQLNNYNAAQFIMEVKNENDKTLLISDWGNLFKKGTYKFIFTARTTLSTCPKLSIIEKSNCKDPYDVSNESYIIIRDNQLINNYEFITSINDNKLNLTKKQDTVRRIYIVIKVENTTTIYLKNNSENFITISFGDNFTTRFESDYSIQLNEGVHLIQIRGYVSEYNIDITI